MKIKDMQKILPIDPNEVEVDQTRIVVDHFFNKPSVENYREEALNFLVDCNGIRCFNSEFNIIHEMAERLIRMICPNCGQALKVTSGSGNIDYYTVEYRCNGCMINMRITMPHDGIHIDKFGD